MLWQIAAYKLDHRAWAGVPPTIAYELQVEGKSREGSVQSFIDHNHSAVTRCSVEEVRTLTGVDDRTRMTIGTLEGGKITSVTLCSRCIK